MTIASVETYVNQRSIFINDRSISTITTLTGSKDSKTVHWARQIVTRKEGNKVVAVYIVNGIAVWYAESSTHYGAARKALRKLGGKK